MSDLAALLAKALRAHLADGKRPKLPDYAMFWWQAFCDLHGARRWHAHGAQPIGLAEIEVWARLHRMTFLPRHVALLRGLDAVWLAESAKPAAEAGKTGKPVSAQPLTAEIFDAMFP